METDTYGVLGPVPVSLWLCQLKIQVQSGNIGNQGNQCAPADNHLRRDLKHTLSSIPIAPYCGGTGLN